MLTGMKAAPDCIPCSLKQVLSTARRVSDDEWLHARVVKRVMATMAQASSWDLATSPAEVTFAALRAAMRILGEADPYAEEKKHYNALVNALLPELRKRVAESSDPVALAAKLAIAGNIIDLGILTGVDAAAEIGRAMETKLAVDDTAEFREAARSAKSVLYLLDNAGEVVLDRLLVEILVKQPKRRQVTCLVRHDPILNDVTAADAEEAGLSALCEIRDPGAPMLGLVRGLCDPAIWELFEKADLVIAKGQANFETLCNADREVFFFLRAKCPVVASALGIAEGAAALVHHEPDL